MKIFNEVNSIYKTTGLLILYFALFSVATAQDITPPSIPANLTAIASAETQVNLTWFASSDNVGVTGYNIYRDGILIVSSILTSYSDVGLLPFTTYSYEVSALDAAANESPRSNPVSTQTLDITPPSTPTNLSTNAVSETQVDLTWSTSTDNAAVTKYNIYRDGVLVGTSNTTSFSNTGLQASNTYTYAISALDAAGNESFQSGSAPAITPDTTRPSRPPNFTANAISETQINLNWGQSSDNIGVVSYNIFRNGALIANITGTSYSDTGLKAFTTYAYDVTAIDAEGNESSPSSKTEKTPDLTPPEVSFIDPANGDTLNGEILFEVSATDNVGIADISGYIKLLDGSEFLIAKDKSNDSKNPLQPPHTQSFETSFFANGTYDFRVIVKDFAGLTDEAKISINIGNVPPSSAGNFKLNERVETTSSIILRSGPSVTDMNLGNIAAGSPGVVMDQALFISGEAWVPVKFDNGGSGWVRESNLKRSSIPMPTPPPPQPAPTAPTLPQPTIPQPPEPIIPPAPKPVPTIPTNPFPGPPIPAPTQPTGPTTPQTPPQTPPTSGGGSISINFSNPLQANTPAEFIKSVGDILIIIGVPAAVIFLFWAGFLFVTSRGSEEKLARAKQLIYWTLIGVAFIIGAWFFANLILNFAATL